MDYRNKSQSLVLPTDDPGEAPDCITEYGHCTCEYGHIRHTAPTAEELVFTDTQAAFSPRCGRNRQIVMASLKIWPTAVDRNRENHQIVKSKHIFLRKSAIFQSLMRGTAKWHDFFAYWRPFFRQRLAWPHGADPPIPHMHIGKIGQFFKTWVYRHPSWIRVEVPIRHLAPPEHPRDTSRTPPARCCRLLIRPVSPCHHVSCPKVNHPRPCAI